jgi:SAM-dependent methyltransferase
MVAKMYSYDGFCPCCEQIVLFSSSDEWFRDHLFCSNCDSVVRERALALVLNEICPNWRFLSIHESSPANRGISRKLQTNAPRYLASQFFPNEQRGVFIGKFRNEDMENQTFHDEIFDVVISLDVMEHVFEPAKVYREVYRTLRKGGHYIHTFPIRKWQTSAASKRAEIDFEKNIKHLVESPEYHSNPIDPGGSLVTYDYGYDITRQIAEWSGFDVKISRFWDQYNGIIGEYTEVVDCRKS